MKEGEKESHSLKEKNIDASGWRGWEREHHYRLVGVR